MPRSLPGLENECFVISPIGLKGSPERERSDGVLEFIIARAVQELGLTAVRGDQLAEPGLITRQVIDHVLGARAAVVDLTDLNPNVFYELAVRHTARLPVALIAEHGCQLPFDIAQMRTIFFDSTNLRSADQCREDIVKHLRQALDGGAVDSPIATSVDVRALAEGSVMERNIAEIVTSVEYVAKMQRSVADGIGELRRGLDNAFTGEPALLEATDLILEKVSALELAAVAQLPDHARFQDEIHEITEMLNAIRTAALRGHRLPPRRSSRPTIRSFAEVPGTETG
jgi:hypothetical protein